MCRRQGHHARLVDLRRQRGCPAAASIRQFRIPIVLPEPRQITAGPDGALWFTESGGTDATSKVGRITTAGAIREFPIPTDYAAFPFPTDYSPGKITSGPDGALWFTESGNGFLSGDKIGRITTAGAISQCALPDPDSTPYGIASGPDGALWFTEASIAAPDAVGRIQTARATRKGPSMRPTRGPGRQPPR